MWFGIAWRIRATPLFEIVGIVGLFTYLAGWVKGQKSTEKGE